MGSGSVRAGVATGHWSWVNSPPKVEVHNGNELSRGRGGLMVQECGTVAELLSEASFACNGLGGEAKLFLSRIFSCSWALFIST